MEDKSAILDKAVKISIIVGILMVALSVVYYLFIFLPKKENTRIEEQKQAQNVNTQQQAKIEELQNFKNEQEQKSSIVEEKKVSEQVSPVSKVSCLSFSNFKVNKQTGYLEYYESTKSVSESECELIKQKNDRTKEIIDSGSKNLKTINDWLDKCIQSSMSEDCIDKANNEKGTSIVNTITKLKNVWGTSAVYDAK